MTTITGLTAARMLAIEGASVVDGEVVSGELILTKHDGTTINAGSIAGPAGPTGPAGPAGGLIPGEVRLWPGGTLPLLATYGKWVWADGAVYAVATYPIAAGHIASQWRTFGGASDPGGSNFRVPDLRGVVPAGLDQMPGGSRANRMTRSVAITIAAKTGEETHIITVPEMAGHGHGITDPGHGHGITDPGHRHNVNRVDPGEEANPEATFWNRTWFVRTLNDSVGTPPDNNGYNDPLNIALAYTGIGVNGGATGISIGMNGGGGAHENVQPTVFVPYIVKLDD